MKRILISLAVLSMIAAAAHAACTVTGFYRDGINLTASLINPASVTGTVDATGCNIGVYYDSGVGTIANANIFGANYFGVVNNGATVNVSSSLIYKIGESPFNGSQHGVAIYFTGGGSGTIDSNQVSAYQKGGIVGNGTGTKVTITNNVVTGLGPVPFIAQNGIQVSRSATGEVSGNSISANFYTACSNQDAAKTGCIPWVSAGLLLYDVDANAIKKSNNQFRDNQRNMLLLTSQSLHSGI